MKFNNLLKFIFTPAIFIKDLFKEKEQEEEIPVPEFKPSRNIYILDNGHGKETKGKKFKHPSFTFYEWEFTRAIVKLIAEKLTALNIDFHVLVPEDRDIDINARVNRANRLKTTKDKITISIHANAISSNNSKIILEKAIGTETLYHYGSDRGRMIANIFQAHLVYNLLEVPEFYSRGIKPRNDLGILKGTNHPAIITESGFYTNEEQAKDLLNSEVQDAIAEAHVKAIMFLENL